MAYYRIRLGAGGTHAEECFKQGCIGLDYSIDMDLSGRLPEEYRDFNQEFIPVYLAKNPEKSRIAAGLCCGMLWTACKGIENNDWVLSPDENGNYLAGQVAGHYFYVAGGPLPHRRPVRWLTSRIPKDAMSAELLASAGGPASVCEITSHQTELARLLGQVECPAPMLSIDDPEVENPKAFALEKHLEDFLVENWAQTELGKGYDIFSDEGEIIGQQYRTDTGPIDILAISKDKKTLLVIELKKGKSADAAVGQTLRYMGYVADVLAVEGQTVKGAIIALEDSKSLRRALSLINDLISFYQYRIEFELVKS